MSDEYKPYDEKGDKNTVEQILRLRKPADVKNVPPAARSTFPGDADPYEGDGTPKAPEVARGVSEKADTKPESKTKKS